MSILTKEFSHTGFKGHNHLIAIAYLLAFTSPKNAARETHINTKNFYTAVRLIMPNFNHSKIIAEPTAQHEYLQLLNAFLEGIKDYFQDNHSNVIHTIREIFNAEPRQQHPDNPDETNETDESDDQLRADFHLIIANMHAQYGEIIAALTRERDTAVEKINALLRQREEARRLRRMPNPRDERKIRTSQIGYFSQKAKSEELEEKNKQLEREYEQLKTNTASPEENSDQRSAKRARSVTTAMQSNGIAPLEGGEEAVAGRSAEEGLSNANTNDHHSGLFPATDHPNLLAPGVLFWLGEDASNNLLTPDSDAPGMGRGGAGLTEFPNP